MTDTLPDPLRSADLRAATLPVIRPRRLRATPALRRFTQQTRVHPAELILPMFVRESVREPVPIGSMPGVVQHSLD